MNDSHVFVDTNVLVYAHDTDAGDRHDQAKEKLRAAWDRPLPPSVSVQVLQELYVNLVRKGATRQAARAVVEDYLQWDVIATDTTLLGEGMRVAERFKLSLWDALVVAAAQRAGAAIIWSEDLNDNQDYGGARVVNPFKDGSV